MMFEQHSLFDTRWLADRPRDYGSPLVTLWVRRLRVLCAGNSDVLIRNHAVARQRGTGPLSCLDAVSGGCCALRNVCKRMRSRSNRFLMISFAAVKAPVFPIP